MKKKLILLLLSTMLALSACGSKPTPADVPEESTSAGLSNEETGTGNTDIEDIQTGESDDTSDLEAVGEIEVDEGLFDVELSIPADFVGESTQEDLDAIAEEKGYKSVTLNSDGSATYIMTKKQHKDMMDEMADTLNDSLSEMVGSEDYPNFTNIKANDTFTEFTVTTTSSELDLNESFSVLAFYMYGGMYNIFNGTPTDNIIVTFVNADSGEVISTSNSSDT